MAAQVSRSQDGVPANRAIVVVSLPAHAMLYLNSLPTRSQGPVRTFITPELEPGATFTYTFRMESFENGQRRSQTQDVTFQPGRHVAVSFGPSGDLRVATHQK